MRARYLPLGHSNGRGWLVTLRYLAICALTFAVTTSTAFVYWWLQSDSRRFRSAVDEISCLPIHWKYFPAPEASSYLSGSAHYLPSTNQSMHGEAKLSKISHLQACSRFHASSDFVGALVHNHMQYCDQHGIEYILRTGKGNGVWLKIIAAVEKLEEELGKSVEDRKEWIFMSDMDTLFINAYTSLEALLPPKDVVVDPFLLVTQDENGLNAGVFMFKVEHRSLKLFRDVLAFDRQDPRLNFFEQTAIKIMIEEKRLVETGQAVFMPSQFFNSYAGMTAFDTPAPTAMLHFPSQNFKRDELIPYLDRLMRGEINSPSEEHQRQGALAYNLGIAAFWETCDPFSPNV